MREVACGAWIGRNSHIFSPFTSTEAGLLIEFAFSGVERVLAVFHHTCAEFVAAAAQSVAILMLHHKFAIGGDSYHVHPFRIFEHPMLIVNHPVGHTYFIFAGGKPRAANHIFALEDFPIFIFVCHIF